MDIVKQIGLFIWAVLGIWQAYMTGGIVIAILGIYERVAKRTISLRTFIIGVIAFLLVAFFMAWREQYRAALTAKAQLSAMTVPNFSGAITQVSVAPAGKSYEDALVTIFARIRNSGAPSIAEVMGTKIRLKNGKEVPLIEISRPQKTIVFGTADGQTFQVDVNDYLPRKAMLNPVPTGGAVFGFIVGLVRGVTQAEAMQLGNTVILTYKDIAERPYEISAPMTGTKTEIIHPSDVQPK